MLTISYVLPSTQRTICTGSAKVLLGLKKKSAGQTRKNSWLMSELKLLTMECIICCWMKSRCWIVLKLY